MKNIKALFLLSFLVIISFVFAHVTSAQTPPAQSGSSSSQRWVCLDAKSCGDGSTQCLSGGAAVHTVKLSAKQDLKLLSNIASYVVECLSDGSSEICTTGKPDVDMKIYGQDNSAKMATSFQYKFVRMVQAKDGVTPATNPTISDANGDIGPFEWESETADLHARKFLAVNFFNGIFADPGASGGQQQGTLDFETSAKSCAAFNWDPYGRVFDSKTLEPLKGVSVSLMKKRDDGSFSPLLSTEVIGGAITNPQTTKADGEFTFVVPDATYHLAPSVGGYKFPVDSLSTLNPVYTKVYTDIYPAGTGQDILQRGAIVHRDIPMEAVGASQSNPVEMMEYFSQVDKLSNSYIIEGRVSHPFTSINIWTQKVAANGQVTPRYRKIISADADKTGYFKVVVNQKDFEKNEMVGEAEMVKKSPIASKGSGFQSLIQKIMGLFVPQASAQDRTSKSVKLTPIPNYLEGLAYDANGKPVANATVSVYLTFSSVPYYTTKADADGHFKVTSEYLPFMPYRLEIMSPISKVATKVATDTFLVQNSKYIETNQINVNEYKDTNGRTGQQVLTEKANNAAAKMKQDAAAMAKPAESSNNFTIVIFVIMLLVVISVILLLYVKNKKKSPTVEL